jgi:hypothetical protein
MSSWMVRLKALKKTARSGIIVVGVEEVADSSTSSPETTETELSFLRSIFLQKLEPYSPAGFDLTTLDSLFL